MLDGFIAHMHAWSFLDKGSLSGLQETTRPKLLGREVGTDDFDDFKNLAKIYLPPHCMIEYSAPFAVCEISSKFLAFLAHKA